MINRLITPFFLLLSACSLMHAAEVRVAASDLLAEYITKPLEAYGEENEITFDIEAVGSLPALDQLSADEVDLAIIAVPTDREAPRDEFRIYPFAYNVAIVAVNANNPIDEINIDNLAGIFGSNEEYNFNAWGDLGLKGWSNRSIKPMAGLTKDSISLELFKNSVFKGGVMKTSVTVVKDDEVELLLASDAASIAVLSRMPESNKVKALMVSNASGSPAFGPTEDNVHFGDYPIRLSFFIAFKKGKEVEMANVLRVLLGDEVAESLSTNHLYPLPYTVRRKLVIDLDLEK